MTKEFLILLLKRILASLVVLFLLVSFIFILLRVSPGDPTLKFVSPGLSPRLAEKIKTSFDLNAPVLHQYYHFLINTAGGNFGISYQYHKPVFRVIAEYLPFTIIFSIISFIFQIGFGFIFALAGVKKAGGKLDRALSKLSLAVYAMPSFVLGVLLIFIFSEKINLFPSSGFSSFEASSLGFWGRISDYLNHMVLPLITLSAGGAAVFYRYIRDNLDEIYNKPFILKLRAEGVKDTEIALKHVIPNAVSPLVSVAGVELGILLSGALITEVIFGLPGMGRLTINAILSRDYPLVVGCAFTSGTLVILSNLAADIVRAKIDPRIMKGVLN